MDKHLIEGYKYCIQLYKVFIMGTNNDIFDTLSTEAFNNPKRTTTMTFRIESNTVQQLKIKAQKDEISLNTLVNRVLKRYTEWGVFIEDRPGIISLAKPVALELFNNLEKEQIVKLAIEVGKAAVIDLTLFMKGNLNPNLFMEWFVSRMKNSSAIVTSKDDRDGHKTVIIKHDMGKNWSLYHKTVVESIFNEMHKPIRIVATESTLILEAED